MSIILIRALLMSRSKEKELEDERRLIEGHFSLIEEKEKGINSLKQKLDEHEYALKEKGDIGSLRIQIVKASAELEAFEDLNGALQDEIVALRRQVEYWKGLEANAS